ncbi:C40 family peptidase [Streptomyces sp. B1866]|uniref:C40 family peptidase n=1 Tax=Streptomyces sp. B1866 TaxID=3075431 RepID=UPI00288CB0F2|nr:C40 family peptidase [Streptomyces sp. B1866]MDT3395346.1 C40 family peptidase [Streptomyces sp. B1866]
MKASRVLAGVVAAGPLLLSLPLVLAVAGNASVSCSNARASEVDAAAVAEQVKRLLEHPGSGGTVKVPGLDDPAVQMVNAKVIQATGVAMGVPARGQVVALATALQESGLRNLDHGDRDSLGLFQQRPSQGWGSAEQILDPVYASTRFYQALRRVTGWESMTVAQAAQAVQKSGVPDAYAKWEPLATALQQALATALTPDVPTASPAPTPGSPSAVPSAAVAQGLSGCDALGAGGSDGGDGSGFGPIPAGALPDGYQIPADAPERVRTAIRWALGQLGTPYQWGGTCAAPHGPDPMGRCDCSSLMQRAYAAAGMRLSRTTYTQVKEGTPVAVGSVRPGDLLFTEGTAAAPGHVGMFIGSGLIVHAPHTGDVVRITTLAAWKPGVLAVRRIIP